MKKIYFVILVVVAVITISGCTKNKFLKSAQAVTITNEEPKESSDTQILPAIPMENEKSPENTEQVLESEKNEEFPDRTYRNGENGKQLKIEENGEESRTYYAYNQSFSGFMISDVVKTCYKTLLDCEKGRNECPLPTEYTYTISEYIYSKTKTLTTGCFKAHNQSGTIYYIPYNNKPMAIHLWEVSTLKEVNGKKFRFFDWKDGAYFRDQTKFYEEPDVTSSVVFINDYAAQGIKYGDEQYFPIKEAAIALDEDDYWVKVETENWSGWTQEEEARKEKGGPTFMFPEYQLDLEFSPM